MKLRVAELKLKYQLDCKAQQLATRNSQLATHNSQLTTHNSFLQRYDGRHMEDLKRQARRRRRAGPVRGGPRGRAVARRAGGPRSGHRPGPAREAGRLGQATRRPAHHLPPGEHREEDFTSADLVVASPAIPPSSPYLAAARAAGVAGHDRNPALRRALPRHDPGRHRHQGQIHHHRDARPNPAHRFTTWVGGNIGNSLLTDLGEIDKTHLVVLELSQLHAPLPAADALVAARGRGDDAGAGPPGLARVVRGVRRRQAEPRRASSGPTTSRCVNEESPGALELARASAGRVVRFGVAGAQAVRAGAAGAAQPAQRPGARSRRRRCWACHGTRRRRPLRDFAGLPHRLQLVHESAACATTTTRSPPSPRRPSPPWSRSRPSASSRSSAGTTRACRSPALCAALCERAKAASVHRRDRARPSPTGWPSRPASAAPPSTAAATWRRP